MNDTNHHHQRQHRQQQETYPASSSNILHQEEEQIVTSTSSETISPPQQQQQQQEQQRRLETSITSPAHITSSTGNDCSNSSPTYRVLPHQPTGTTTDASSEDDSQSPQQIYARVALERQRQQHQQQHNEQHHNHLDAAMPTTSAAAAEKLNHSPLVLATAAASAAAAAATSAAARNPSINNIRNGKVACSSSYVTEMVAREILPATVADSGGDDAGDTETSSPSVHLAAGSHENHKIILKLPKPPPMSAMSSSCNNDESHMDVDPSTTSSCSNSSTNSVGAAPAPAEDTRKVEPLKINLHSHSQNTVPKITIKPIVKKPNEIASDGGSSSSAEDDVVMLDAASGGGGGANTNAPAAITALRANSPIPKLTIKAISSSSPSTSTLSSSSTTELVVGEPHIVPKLTIRSASGEEGGATHSTIVPKLTIKISDTTSSAPLVNNSLHTTPLSSISIQKSSSNTSASLMSLTTAVVAGSTSSASSSSAAAASLAEPQPPPPLPKLTIKTSVDGTSESIISTISPASLSSSSSSSTSSSSSSSSTSPFVTSAAAAAMFASTTTRSSSISSATVATIPKLTIKTVQKPMASLEETVPKLTIKTNAATGDACVSQHGSNADDMMGEDNCKIPKLTIKTGQEHAVIITQHSDVTNAQTVPKLTIKTKSLDVEESLSDPSDESPPEKIPKLTIKTNELPAATAASTETPKFSIKSSSNQSNDHHHVATIPKLTISVTSSGTVSNLDGTTSSPQSPKQSPLMVRQIAVTCSSSSRKPASPDRVPKLMISRQDSTIATAANHCDIVTMSEKTVPKLTIKTNNIDSGSSACDTKDKGSAKFLIKNNSSVCVQEDEKIPKLTIKTIPHAVMPSAKTSKQQLPSSEDSDDCQSRGSSPPPPPPQTQDEPQQHTNKVVPKLTIKNLSSPKLKIKAVLEDTAKTLVRGGTPTPTPTSNADTASKKCSKNSGDTKSGNAAGGNVPPLVEQHPRQQAASNNADTKATSEPETRSHNALISVSAAVETTVVNGESSNSQEFCGFNDNTTESALDAAAAGVDEAHELMEDTEEPRRHSDDMDIDEGLQEHDPQIFNNVTHFNAAATTIAASSASTTSTSNGAATFPMENRNLPAQPLKHPQLTHVIDTVDLTSASPSPGSSPAHFNYTDADPHIPTASMTHQAPTSAQIMERLQRETSVIQTAPAVGMEKTSFLLNQLTNPSKYAAPPPLQPKPHHPHLQQQQQQHMLNSNSCAKYPQLAERLMANGALSQYTMFGDSSASSSTTAATASGPAAVAAPENQKPQETVIDSIEILDTPEGSPRSSLDEMPAGFRSNVANHFSHHQHHQLQHQHQMHQGNDVGDMFNAHEDNNSADVLRRNNNTAADTNHIVSRKRHHMNTTATSLENHHLMDNCLDISPNKLRRIENDSHTMATLTILTNDDETPMATVITTSPTMIGHGVGDANHHHHNLGIINATEEEEGEGEDHDHLQSLELVSPKQHHRSRKQKHEHLLTIPIEELDEDPLNAPLDDSEVMSAANCFEPDDSEPLPAAPAAETATPIAKRRGRPKKNAGKPPAGGAATSLLDTADSASNDGGEHANSSANNAAEKPSKTRLTRVQLLRKRLAIDMVASELLTTGEEDAMDACGGGAGGCDDIEMDDVETATPRRGERALRTSRRSATPNVLGSSAASASAKKFNDTKLRKQLRVVATPIDSLPPSSTAHLNNFGGSNSSLSSVCSSSSLSCAATTITKTVANVTMAAQIDLTMSSSSSSSASTSNGSTSVVTTVAASASAQSRMLPPTTILSSSDPVPDVVFKPNDFSSIMATQQLRSPHRGHVSANSSQHDSQDEDGGGGNTGGSGADNSGYDSASSSSMTTTPRRGRGRGRGARSGRGGAGSGSGSTGTPGGAGSGNSGSARGNSGTRGHRLGRGASAVAKAIAMSRPRCVGGLKHTPDPERLKGLFSPSPQVFEEDTRMSADLTQFQLPPEPVVTPIRQPDFLTNEESQSSVVSNASILDPNTVAAVQNGSAIKRPKKKKMEVCVAEDADFTVASIAEYDWPPPKGCCPSKNRDTFMIQEQVALYLGIKSFKRKYPDLPRRQIDMEERNWLQEKQLVTERMCDLGITAVWASDVLDIMYSDFYSKYEEYKDFIRQKHLREIETKQKALGLNVTGRGLQARDRAMLSASKWNAYFNRSRKEERVSCLDLQTLTVNVPSPASAPSTTLVNRPIAEAVAAAAKESSIAEPPTLLKPRLTEQRTPLSAAYPLALVPGQFCAQYRHYTPLELRSHPLNTVLDDPRTLHERLSQLNAAEDDTDTAQEEGEENVRTAASASAVNANNASTKTNSAKGIASKHGSSAAEAVAAIKRLPVRRSRRARTNAAAERTKTKCDTKSEGLDDDEDDDDEDDVEKMLEKTTIPTATAAVAGAGAGAEVGASSTEGSTSSSASSSSGSSSSETDSETDSCYSADAAASSSSEEDEHTPPACGVCQRTQHRNLKGLPEVFVKCYTCRRKVHPSCIEMPHRMVGRVRNYNWQCADCKCCIKCKRKQDQNKMLFCEQCDRGFHIYCLGVKAVPDGRWSCERCSICMRCGATKPDGMPLPAAHASLLSPNGEKIKQVKHKKVKWINEYRIDHITKLREHCSMLCVPCGRARTTTKRVQSANNNNNNGSSAAAPANSMSTSSSSILTQQQNQLQLQQQQQQQQQQLQQASKQQQVSHATNQPQHTQMSPPAAPPPPPPPPVVA